MHARRRTLAGAHRRSRHSARRAWLRRRDVAHARSVRFRVGWRSPLPEYAPRGLPGSARLTHRRRPHLRVQLLAQRSRRPRRRGGVSGHLPSGPDRTGPTALRFRVSDAPIHFDDLFQGPQHFDLATCGDVVVERRDGWLATSSRWWSTTPSRKSRAWCAAPTCCASTPWQIDLQKALSLPQPIYGHLPLLLEPDGAKLSKSRQSAPARSGLRRHELFSTLTHLSQAPPPELAHSSIKEVWNWAIGHWNPQALAGKAEVRLSAQGDSEAESHGENCGVQRGVLR